MAYYPVTGETRREWWPWYAIVAYGFVDRCRTDNIDKPFLLPSNLLVVFSALYPLPNAYGCPTEWEQEKAFCENYSFLSKGKEKYWLRLNLSV